MNIISLLDNLKAFAESETANILLPVAVQKEGEEETSRAPEVHKMRLPNSKQWKKKAPYILIQALTSADQQLQGQRPEASCTVRFVFCVYCRDEEEGAMNLLNLMERLRIALLKTQTISGFFRLDLTEAVESMVYTADEAPYFGGELLTSWHIPAIEREVNLVGWQP